jgi:flagellar motor switch protein FliN/FliY
MMEPTPDPQAPDYANWLMEQWTAALAAAIESMTEDRPEVQFAPRGDPATGETGESAGALCWEQGFGGIEPPAMWVTAPEKTWLELGGRTLRAAGIEAAEPADARNTYLEILSQSLAAVAQSMGARLRREVACERGAERKAPGPELYRFTVALRYPETELELEAGLSAALLSALDGTSNRPAEPAEGNAPRVLAASGTPQTLSSPPSKTLDLLMDVDLPVSVSFGRTQLPINEILKLTTGSVVELNRAVSEPVDVIVNNCIVARGEVVVIEGNYGVRIHQIISRQDRLRSLR